MRTAIFVYQPTLINISSSESDLQLSGMDADTVSLSAGDNARTIAPGIYKIVSSQDVRVAGDTAAFDVVVTTNNKDNDPTPPSRAVVKFAPLDVSALRAFLAVPESKIVLNP